MSVAKEKAQAQPVGECLHVVAWKDMCATCGADLAKLDVTPPTSSASYVSMVHTVPDLKVSLTDAKEIDKGEETHLLEKRKLHLLVDLDQTLIHTTNDNVPPDMPDVIHFQLWGPTSPWYHTRLRPGTRDFLEQISSLYQLHICTFGTRSYAHIIARHLDPDGKYFYNRVLSRDECFSQNSKTANLKDLFPNGDHMVCIIDDREDVWNFAPNLIHVKPYHFFSHTGDINAPPGLTKKDDDEKSGIDFSKEKESSSSEVAAAAAVEDHDDYLMYLSDILKQIHQAFYSIHDEKKKSSQENSNETADVKVVIPYVRRKVLKGCSIVFSGVVPVDHSLESSRAYSVAVSLGATVSDKIIPPAKTNSAGPSKESNPTTHLVAARPGTAKVNDARRYKDIHLVTPEWLWCCAERWDHVDEKLFPLYKKSSVRKTPPAHCSSPEANKDDDDLNKDKDKDKANNSQSQEDDDSVFQSTSTSSSNAKRPSTPARRLRTPSGRFMDTINPLLSFSMDEVASMEHEVDDICNESGSDSSSTSDDDDTTTNTSEKSSKPPPPRRKVARKPSIHEADRSGEKHSLSSDSDQDTSQDGFSSSRKKKIPKTETETEEDETLAARFRRGEPLPSDMDTLNLTSSSSDEEVDPDNEWMAQELERDLIGDGFDESSQD